MTPEELARLIAEQLKALAEAAKGPVPVLDHPDPELRGPNE